MAPLSLPELTPEQRERFGPLGERIQALDRVVLAADVIVRVMHPWDEAPGGGQVCRVCAARVWGGQPLEHTEGCAWRAMADALALLRRD
jgi:hypothetical protein